MVTLTNNRSESHFIMKIVDDIRKLINGETTTAATSQNPNHHRIDFVDEQTSASNPKEDALSDQVTTYA